LWIRGSSRVSGISKTQIGAITKSGTGTLRIFGTGVEAASVTAFGQDAELEGPWKVTGNVDVTGEAGAPGGNGVLRHGIAVVGNLLCNGGAGDGCSASGNGGTATLQDGAQVSEVQVSPGADNGGGSGAAGTITIEASKVGTSLSPDAATVIDAIINGVHFGNTYP
jgi:hypothetical protein